MITIDGKKAAANLRLELKKNVSELRSKYNSVPGLTVILVGEDAPSKIYIRNKKNPQLRLELILRLLDIQQTLKKRFF